MCGIVGYVGSKDAVSIILEGLNRLEYRGYDSTGIAVLSEGELFVRKFKGRLDILRNDLKTNPLHGNNGIGHNRWATHGKPSDANAHPHTSYDGLISLVHNGIIENYAEIKADLISKGIEFKSDTDTETIAHLISIKYKETKSFLEAAAAALSELRGAYAIAAICKEEPDKIICVRKESPLIIGLGTEENFIASDIAAIAEHTRKVINLDEGVIACVKADSIEFFDYDLSKVSQNNSEIPIEWTQEAVSKSGFEHFMLKEIFEQPRAIKNSLLGRISSDSNSAVFSTFPLSREEYLSIDKIFIVACGTAYYAALFGKYLIEKIARKPVEVDIASEFRYKNPIVSNNSLFIGISQSGETLDTLASLRAAKSLGAMTLAVTNVLGSQIDREADRHIYTMAGPEIAVASTKAYSTQIAVMYLLAMIFGEYAGTLNSDEFKLLRDACLAAPLNVETVLAKTDEIKKAASWLSKSKDIFFIGRGHDYPMALEGALKMKEISYIHAEAYPSGELKHGPIALIEENTPVVALSTNSSLIDKTIGNIMEVKARGAKVLLITNSLAVSVASHADETIFIGDIQDYCSVWPTAVVLQMLSYYTALELGRDVDKPRNLAKSVTVE